MRHRLSAALLALCLTAGLVLPAAAAGTVPSQSEAAQVVQTLGIMSGDDRGNLNLESPVTRADFITMAVKAPLPTPTCPGATGPPAMWRWE